MTTTRAEYKIILLQATQEAFDTLYDLALLKQNNDEDLQQVVATLRAVASVYFKAALGEDNCRRAIADTQDYISQHAGNNVRDVTKTIEFVRWMVHIAIEDQYE